MLNLPAAELLEATHEFPGPYTFKVIARSAEGQLARVVAAVREELTEPVDPHYTFRQTPSGRHIALTLQVQVADVEQVLAIYRRIYQLPGLIMLL